MSHGSELAAAKRQVWTQVYAATVQALGVITASQISQRDGMDTWERIRERAAKEADVAVEAFKERFDA